MTYEAGSVVTGFSFGSRRSQRISARLYDKTAEMTLKGTDWWEAVWGEEHTPGVAVWRIEFEIGRAALSALVLYRPDAVLAAAPSLWRYCTTDWLTLRSPTGDGNRSRWPLDARWDIVQSSTLAHGGTELGFIRQHKRASSIDRLMPALVGYLVAFAIWAGTTDLQKHPRGTLGQRGERRDRPPDDLRRTGPATPSGKGLPVSHDSQSGAGGARSSTGATLRCPACGSIARRPPSSLSRRLRSAWAQASATCADWPTSGGIPNVKVGLSSQRQGGPCQVPVPV
jgi:hypothetical protein